VLPPSDTCRYARACYILAPDRFVTLDFIPVVSLRVGHVTPVFREWLMSPAPAPLPDLDLASEVASLRAELAAIFRENEKEREIDARSLPMPHEVPLPDPFDGSPDVDSWIFRFET
jgi:hypothetical protein